MNANIETAKKLLNRSVNLADTTILTIIALGTLALAVQLVTDIVLDFINQEPHDLAYMVSELMYPLIVVELFRQVVRQIRHEPFSIKPFLAIGIMVSVRGLLVAHVKIGIGSLAWNEGAMTILMFSLVTILLVGTYHACGSPFQEASSSCAPVRR